MPDYIPPSGVRRLLYFFIRHEIVDFYNIPFIRNCILSGITVFTAIKIHRCENTHNGRKSRTNSRVLFSYRYGKI